MYRRSCKFRLSSRTTVAFYISVNARIPILQDVENWLKYVHFWFSLNYFKRWHYIHLQLLSLRFYKYGPFHTKFNKNNIFFLIILLKFNIVTTCKFLLFAINKIKLFSDFDQCSNINKLWEKYTQICSHYSWSW